MRPRVFRFIPHPSSFLQRSVPNIAVAHEVAEDGHVRARDTCTPSRGMHRLEDTLRPVELVLSRHHYRPSSLVRIVADLAAPVRIAVRFNTQTSSAMTWMIFTWNEVPTIRF